MRPGAATPGGSLLAYGSVSFAYYAYAGLFGTYAPLWFRSLGYSTLAIGILAAMQSSTRLYSPYLWGWLADHHGRSTQWVRLGAALAWGCLLAYVGAGAGVGVWAVTWALFVSTAGVIPISEASLTQAVSRAGGFDGARYGRVRVWGSIGFIVTVVGGGALLQGAGVSLFPWLVSAVLGALVWACAVLPSVPQATANHPAGHGAWAVLRQPPVRWFFASVFFTVLAHTSLYAFLSLYLVSLGYTKTEVGGVWAVGVVAEVAWFWFQGRWMARLSAHGWLVVAALVSALRFAVVAAYGAIPALLVAAQCSHAVTFAAQHSACIDVLTSSPPSALRAAACAGRKEIPAATELLSVLIPTPSLRWVPV